MPELALAFASYTTPRDTTSFASIHRDDPANLPAR